MLTIPPIDLKTFLVHLLKCLNKKELSYMLALIYIWRVKKAAKKEKREDNIE